MHDHVCCQSKMLKQRKPKVLRGRRQPRQPRRRCFNQTMFGPLGIASVAEKATQIGGFSRISAQLETRGLGSLAQPSHGRLKFQERPEKKSCFAALGCALSLKILRNRSWKFRIVGRDQCN